MKELNPKSVHEMEEEAEEEAFLNGAPGPESEGHRHRHGEHK